MHSFPELHCSSCTARVALMGTMTSPARPQGATGLGGPPVDDDVCWLPPAPPGRAAHISHLRPVPPPTGPPAPPPPRPRPAPRGRPPHTPPCPPVPPRTGRRPPPPPRPGRRPGPPPARPGGGRHPPQGPAAGPLSRRRRREDARLPAAGHDCDPSAG